MKKFTIILITFFLSSIIYHLSSGILYAQQVTLSISPPVLEVFIKPGKSILIAYNVGNLGDPVIVSAKVLPFEPKDNLGNVRIKPEFEGPVRFSLDNADIKLEQPFFMKTRDSQQLLLRIRIPEGTPEDDYYYILLVETSPPPTFEGVQSARAKATIGSNILITVTNSGRVQALGRISLFDVLSHWKLRIFDSNDKIPVILVVENKGKNLVKPAGEIVLRGNFGETAKYDLIPQNVLAKSQRIIMATPSAYIDPYQIRQPISLLISGFFIGQYHLSTTVNFGENSPNVFASTSFIAIPFKLIIGFLTAIFIGVLIVKKIQKNEEE